MSQVNLTPVITLSTITRYLTPLKQRVWLLSGLTALLGGALLCPAMKAAPQQARPADAFVHSIGVVTHLRYTDTPYGRYEDLIKPRLSELGIRHIRDGIPPSDSLTKQKLLDLAKLGIKSTLVIDPRGFQQAADAVPMVQSIASSVVAVEGPNELDVNRQVAYKGQVFPIGLRTFQNELYTAIKGNSTTAWLDVIAPAMAHPQNATLVGAVSCTTGNMHSYPGGRNPAEAILDNQWIPAARLLCPGKPIVATETGWHNAVTDTTASQPGVSEQAARKYVPRLYLEYFNRSIKRSFLYEFVDEKSAVLQEAKFGLLRYDGSPKPAFTALKNLITLLKDPGPGFTTKSLDYTLGGDTTNVHRVLLQKRNGAFYLILWQEVPSFNLSTKQDVTVATRKVTLTLNTAVSKAVIYQPVLTTNSLAQATTPRQLTLNVPDHPLIVELMP